MRYVKKEFPQNIGAIRYFSKIQRPLVPHTDRARGNFQESKERGGARVAHKSGNGITLTSFCRIYVRLLTLNLIGYHDVHMSRAGIARHPRGLHSTPITDSISSKRHPAVTKDQQQASGLFGDANHPASLGGAFIKGSGADGTAAF